MYSRVYVEITNICNMNCSFCHGHSRKPRRMTQAEFARVLEQLQGKTNYVYYHLMGEPLTHPELHQFLRMASAQGFKSIITTNGTLVSQRGEALLRCGVHKFNISLHSFEAGSDEAYERYLEQVAAFADAANSAGVIVAFRLWNRGHDGGRNDRTLQLLRERLSGQWAENTRGYRVREKLYLEWGDRFQWPDMEAPLQGNDVFCHGMRDHFGILSDGTVVPCCLDSDGVINLGNVFTQELTEILESHRVKAMVRGFERRCATEALCSRCGYARRFG